MKIAKGAYYLALIKLHGLIQTDNLTDNNTEKYSFDSDALTGTQTVWKDHSVDERNHTEFKSVFEPL